MNERKTTKNKDINKQTDDNEINFSNDRMNFDTSLDGKINIDSKYKN